MSGSDPRLIASFHNAKPPRAAPSPEGRRGIAFGRPSNANSHSDIAMVSIFAVFLGILALVHHWIIPLDSGAGLTFLIATTLLMGMPHGALDVYLARSMGLLTRPVRIMRFFGVYLAAVAVMIALWFLMPGLALGVFLLLSAYHFSEDYAESLGPLAGGCLGASVIVAPAVFHTDSVEQIFSWLAGPSGASLTQLLVLCLPLMAVSTAAAAVKFMKGEATITAEILLLIAGAAALPPLVFFAAFFCCLHAPKHIRAVTLLHTRTVTASMMKEAAPYAIIAVFGVALLTTFLPLATPGAAATAAAFMVLSALSVPHGWLVARLNNRG